MQVVTVRHVDTDNALVRSFPFIDLFLLGGLFIFLTLLPILLIILGYSIIVLAVYIAYKAWLEEPVLNLIQKLKSRRNG